MSALSYHDTDKSFPRTHSRNLKLEEATKRSMSLRAAIVVLNFFFYSICTFLCYLKKNRSQWTKVK